jgi:hypothetical protein
MTTTEVVLYQIKTAQVADFAQISKLAEDFLKTRKGFISRLVKQDHNDKTMFVDIVEWQTLEDALSASEASQTEPSLAPFFQAFEKVINFNHFHNFNE